MAKFNLRSRPTSRFPVEIDGEIFEAEISKLSVTDILIFHRESDKMRAQIQEDGGYMTPEVHANLIDLVSGIIVAIHGLKDEDDQEIVWSSLSANKRLEILGDASLEHLSKIFNEAWEVGRLKDHEKKA